MSWIVFHWLEFLKVLAVYLPIFAILYFSLRKKENAFWWFYGIASFIILTINFGGYFVLYEYSFNYDIRQKLFFFLFFSLCVSPLLLLSILFLINKLKDGKSIFFALIISFLTSLISIIGFFYLIAASVGKFSNNF